MNELIRLKQAMELHNQDIVNSIPDELTRLDHYTWINHLIKQNKYSCAINLKKKANSEHITSLELKSKMLDTANTYLKELGIEVI